MESRFLRYSARRVVLSFMAVGLLLLTGCSSLNVVESWHKQPLPGQHYKKVMILCIADDENLRALFENVVVDLFTHNGVNAVASHTLVKDLDKAHRNDIAAAVRATGSDGLITVRALSVGDTNVTQQGEPGTVYGTAASGYYDLPGAKSYVRETLQTNLYDGKTAELVWSATIKTYDADNEVRVSREAARVFLQQLRQDGFL
jgi:uncharacterized protein YceK